MMRIDKFLANQMNISRKQAKEALAKKRVCINDKVVLKGEVKLDPKIDEVNFEGKVVNYRKYVYLMLSKPKGVVSATKDPSKKTVVDLVPSEYFRKGLFPAGRLDGDTTGFVLITDDGDFAHSILSPSRHVDKTYHARLSGGVSKEDIEKIEQGIELKDGYKCLPAKVRILEDTDQPLAEIILQEGKYHQVKRMFGAVGCKVLELERVKIGQVILDEKLGPGECRQLTSNELESLKRLSK